MDSSMLKAANISPRLASDSAPDGPCRCVRKNGESQAAFAQRSDGARGANQDTPSPYLLSNDAAKGRDCHKPPGRKRPRWT